MVTAPIQEGDEFGPTVSVWRFVGLLALLMFWGHGLLELERVTFPDGWGLTVPGGSWIRDGVPVGLSVGAAMACVSFGRVRRDLSHRALAWFALIFIGPLATLVGVDVVATASGAFPAPTPDRFVQRWAGVALKWALSGGAAAVGLLFLAREPTNRQRTAYATAACVVAVVLALVGRELEVAWFTESPRYACLLPLFVSARRRSVLGATLLATAAVVVSDSFADPVSLFSRMKRAGSESLGVWLGAALPILLARRYEALAATVECLAAPARATRRRVGVAVALLLLAALSAVVRHEPRQLGPSSENLPETLWLELRRSGSNTTDAIGVDGFHEPYLPWISPAGKRIVPHPIWQTTMLAEAWDDPDASLHELESDRLVFAIERPWRPSGLAALLPRTVHKEVVAVYESTEHVEERTIHVLGAGYMPGRWLRFDRRPTTERGGR